MKLRIPRFDDIDWLYVLSVLCVGKRRADRIKIMEQEREFFFENALKWAAVYFEAEKRYDFSSKLEASIAFHDCKRRHAKVCDELKSERTA